jgi:hypothetical protein
MANVDPFVIKWPNKWAQDPELRDALRYLNRFLHDIWKRTGGGEDLIESTIVELTTELTSVSSGQIEELTDTLGQIEDRIPAPFIKDFYAATKSQNYTAVDSDFIEANNNAIITLDPNADLNDQIIIANGDGSKITVKGGDNKIKYTKTDSSLVFRDKGSSLHFQLFADETQKFWRIR